MLVVATKRPQGWPTGTKQQDRESQYDHSPRNESGALVVAVGQFGRYSDVGHLKEAERGGRQYKSDEHPAAGNDRVCARRNRESKNEKDRQGERPEHHKGAPSTGASETTVAARTNDRVNHDVPDFGKSDEQTCRERCNSESVGHEVNQHEARQCCKASSSQRTDGVRGNSGAG